MNKTLTTKLNCEQPILTLKIIGSDKSYLLKVSYLPDVRFKNYEVTPKKSPLIKDFPTVPRACPYILKRFYFFCILLSFFFDKMVQSAKTVHHMPKDYQTT
jgi:hypothetical protein